MKKVNSEKKPLPVWLNIQYNWNLLKPSLILQFQFSWRKKSKRSCDVKIDVKHGKKSKTRFVLASCLLTRPKWRYLTWWEYLKVMPSRILPRWKLMLELKWPKDLPTMRRWMLIENWPLNRKNRKWLENWKRTQVQESKLLCSELRAWPIRLENSK